VERKLYLHPFEKPGGGLAGLPDDQEAQPPKDDQVRDRKVDQNVPSKAHEVIAVNRKPGVAEGRDRMKDAGEKRSGPGLVLEEAEEKEDKPSPFDNGREQKNVLDQGPEIARRPGVVALLHQDAVADRDRASRGQKDHGGEGHDAQPAELDQQEDDTLTGGREIGRRIDDDKAGNADGRGRGEQGVDERDPARSRAEGKHKEKSAQENGGREADGQHLGRLEQSFFMMGDAGSPLPGQEKSIISAPFCQQAEIV